jgi:hypothetical protein
MRSNSESVINIDLEMKITYNLVGSVPSCATTTEEPDGHQPTYPENILRLSAHRMKYAWSRSIQYGTLFPFPPVTYGTKPGTLLHASEIEKSVQNLAKY